MGSAGAPTVRDAKVSTVNDKQTATGLLILHQRTTRRDETVACLLKADTPCC